MKGWSRSRPIRIAFLVENNQHSAAVLDAVFADCYNRWGGRFSLVIPCVEGKIPSPYWHWLDAYDADVIYSYVSLERQNVLDLHERLSPATYIQHRSYRDRPDDPLTYRPEYHFEPLSSLSTIFRSARHASGAPIKLIDSWYSEEPSRFLTDNFGTYHTSRASGIYPSDAKGAASLLTIVAPDIRADRRRAVPRELDAIDSESDAFTAFAEGRATSLSMAAQLFAPRLNIDGGRWSDAFNLVVGDTFADRVVFWNARFFIPSWLDTNLCCLRITVEQTADAEFVRVLVNLLNRHNHVNGGSGGQYNLAVRSCSLNNEQLELAINALSANNIWGAIRKEAVANVDEVVPTLPALARALEYSGESLLPRSNWLEFGWNEPSAHPPASPPDHLSDAPPRQSFAVGYWAADYLLEVGALERRSGDTNVWLLPRRWRMSRSFAVTFTAESPSQRAPTPRRSRPGMLAVYCSIDRVVRDITAPTVLEAFDYALFRDGQGTRLDAEPAEPISKVYWAQPSNEARYFAGVLGITGSLDQAAELLLHPFLKGVFANFGGTPALEPNWVTPTVSRLQKLAPKMPSFDLQSDHEREVLAGLIVKAARGQKDSLAFVRYEHLKAEWKKHRAAYWNANPIHGGADPTVDWDRYEEESLDAALIWMRNRQILFQGHQWICSNCHHRNWVDMTGLKSELACDVCKETVPSPVSVDWLFRPNEFLIESLRDHSVLSLVWVLISLRDRSRRSFVYAGPTWLYYNATSEDEPNAEADLLVVVDGRAYLCEVKSSWRGLRASDIRDLVDLSKRLRPDVALLAVMESGIGLVEEVAAAKNELEAAGIQFEVLLPHSQDQFDTPYLPAREA